jgi:hypothetical protein
MSRHYAYAARRWHEQTKRSAGVCKRKGNGDNLTDEQLAQIETER